jgi:hypothetical protein
VVIDDNLSLASQEMDSNWVSLTSSHIAIKVNPEFVYHKIKMKQKGEQMSFLIKFAVFLSILQSKESSLVSSIKSRK